MKVVKGWVLKSGSNKNCQTFNVTIPNKEATALGISKGDVLNVFLKEGNIAISKELNGKGRSVMKCGNSLSLTIPKEIWDVLGLEHGDCFIVELKGEELIYKRIEG